MSKQFSNLNAWKNARELCIFVYSLTDNYPSKEQFAITSQTTRAAVSVVANIAEGSSRSSNKDFAHFLEIAIGSAFELETLTDIAFERRYFNIDDKNKIDTMIEKTLKLTFGLKRTLL